MKRWFILILFLAGSVISAQNRTYRQIDSLTYVQYANGNWQALIQTGEQALSQGIRFLNLDYRMGIAYYHLRKYIRAIPFFENVRENRRQDKIAAEYLYYAYLYADRVADARKMAAGMDADFRKKIHLKEKEPFIASIETNVKYDFDTGNVYNPSENEYVVQFAPGPQKWYQAGLTHRIGPDWTFYHSFSYLTTFNTVQTYGYDFPQRYPEKVRQYDYYFLLSKHFSGSWDVSLAGHYLQTHVSAEDLPEEDTPGLPYEIRSNSFMFFTGVHKNYRLFRFGSGVSFSNLNDTRQVQPEISVGIYPFARNNLYLETKITAWHQTGEKTGFVLNGSVAWHPKINLYISPFVSVGDLYNYHEYDAFIIYNDTDVSHWRAGIGLTYGLMRNKWQILILYKMSGKENVFTINEAEHTYPYVRRFVNLGLTYNL